MFYWATILTFILAIMITLLYPRPDRVKIEDDPASEAYISNFLVQHQAARDFLDSIAFALPYMQESPGIDLTEKDTEEAKHIHVLSENFDYGIMPQIVPADGYMGISYNLFPDSKKFRHKDASEKYGFTSAIACMSRVDKKDPDGTQVYGNVMNCQDEAGGIPSFKYLITYGLLFQNENVAAQHNLFRKKVAESLLWEKALATRSKNSPDCGYIDLHNDEPHIMTVNGPARRLPKNLYNVYSDYLNENQNNQPIFCITPINTPYILNGLIYHFDSNINFMDDTGPQHQMTKSTWSNIITKHPHSIVTTDTANPQWNTEGGTYLMMRGQDSFPIQIQGNFDEEQNLTNMFTISMVVRFKSGYELNEDGSSFAVRYPVLGTDESLTFPSLKAEHSNAILKLTLAQNSATEAGELRVNIPPNKISYITYVIGPSFHQLYVDGVSKASETFKNGYIFSGLRPANIIVGSDINYSDKLNADIFNIKIYNRILTENEIQYNHRTDKKRFEF